MCTAERLAQTGSWPRLGCSNYFLYSVAERFIRFPPGARGAKRCIKMLSSQMASLRTNLINTNITFCPSSTRSGREGVHVSERSAKRRYCGIRCRFEERHCPYATHTHTATTLSITRTPETQLEKFKKFAARKRLRAPPSPRPPVCGKNSVQFENM